MSTSAVVRPSTLERVAAATLPAIDAFQLGIKSVSDPLHLSNPGQAL